MANEHIYSDLDLTFRRQPVKGDVSFSYDEQAVIRSIKNLLQTSPFERLFHPTLGTSLNQLLFEPCTPLTASLVQDEIIRMINNYEPRATVYNVEVTSSPDQNSFNVSIYVFVGNETSPTAINLILKRTR